MPIYDIETEKKALAKEYKELLRISYQSLSKDDKKLIRKAFDYAVDAHQHQRRKSGEAYIFHPIAVAKIVASEIGLDAVSIASALIHDVVEDNSDHTLERIQKEFGDKIAKIVDGLTKIGKLNTKGYSLLPACLMKNRFKKHQKPYIFMLHLHTESGYIILKQNWKI